MEIRYFQRGFNYAQDGPGNRLVYHLTGCNMRCPWCANPEGMLVGGTGRQEPVQQIFDAICAARPMFFDGGGLTLTGGEVSVQLDAALELLALSRAAGIHTCVETNATGARFGRLLEYVDLLIADYKHPDSAAHEKWTGMGSEQIERNLRLAAEAGGDVLFRIPLIHGVNDDDAALDGFVRFFAPLSRPGVSVEVLPYHEYGKDKWIACVGAYAMEDAFVSPVRVKQLEEALRSAGLAVTRT